MVRFDDYTAKEAEAVAREFIAAASGANLVHTAEWTDLILGHFKRTADESKVVVDARPSVTRRTWGEFMVDLSHSTFPRYESVGWNSVAYWKAAYQGVVSPRLCLALESEMGSSGSSALNVCRVMEDAAKLFVLQADVKVMVFASCGPTNRDEILGLAHAMAQRDQTRTACWLWIDLPWEQRWSSDWGPSAWIVNPSGPVVIS